MNDEHVGAHCHHLACERIEAGFRILIIDADPAFHGDGNGHRALHGMNALGDQIRLGHQASAEAAILHPIRWAADVEVDLVVAKIFADPRRHREVCGIRSAKLECDGMFDIAEPQQAIARAMDDRAGGQHLSIEPRTTAQMAVEDAAMPVSPVHHRRNRKYIIL